MVEYPFLNLDMINAPYADEMKKAAARVIDSGRFIGGGEVTMLENDLADLVKAPFAVGTSNGLDALRLILEGYKQLGRLKDGDEVLVSGNTYVASALAVSQVGLRPVPVEPSPETMNITAESIDAAVTGKVKAVMPVHLYGRVAWDKDIADVCACHGLLVVEDAAQAIGARSVIPGMNGSDYAGALGHAGAFSFYPTKNVGALGDAGAVVTNDEELAHIVRALANYGSDRRYHNIYRGYNCRLDPIQAAFLRIKLKDVKDVNQRRRLRAEAYSRLIISPYVTVPVMPADGDAHVWHQYVVRVHDGLRDAFRGYLLDNGVETDVHYPVPFYRQPCYAGLNIGELPVCDRLAGEIVSLPVSDCTRLADVEKIAEIINSFSV
ncbi:MAG: DegT/DnrJ/EryC1/StrS family aminotransferase [Paramuribaculum sp.]|nr:DegT/DnrJ/EryC1/StrS family aminotransferase [Paramuribaculum sp.]